MTRDELEHAAATQERVIKLHLTRTSGVRSQVGQGVVEKRGDDYWLVSDGDPPEPVDMDVLGVCYELERPGVGGSGSPDLGEGLKREEE